MHKKPPLYAHSGVCSEALSLFSFYSLCIRDVKALTSLRVCYSPAHAIRTKFSSSDKFASLITRLKFMDGGRLAPDLKQFFINVSYHILVASLTQMTLFLRLFDWSFCA